MKKLAIYFFVVVSLVSIIQANQLRFEIISPKIVPETSPNSGQSYNHYCWYPIAMRADSSGFNALSIDAKFFASGFIFTGSVTGNNFSIYTSSTTGYYSLLTGVTLVEQSPYVTGSQYYYINATDITGVILQSGLLVSTFFKSTGDFSTGEFIWYFITGTGDESQMQVDDGFGNFFNVISSVGNPIFIETYYDEFMQPNYNYYTYIVMAKRPCILDTDNPIIQGHSGTINYFTENFYWSTFDRTGAKDIFQSGSTSVSNPTIHYYRTGGQYIPAPSDIDNQMGISSGCVTVQFTGGTATTGEWTTWTGEVGAQSPFSSASTLTPTHHPISNPPISFSSIISNGGQATYAGSGAEITWNTNNGGSLRGYTFSKILSGLKVMNDNQRVNVKYVTCDNYNQNGVSRGGSLSTGLYIIGFDKIYPHLKSGSYFYTGRGGTSHIWLEFPTYGLKFSTGEIENRTGRTSGNVVLVVTGSEPITILTGTITGVIAPYLSGTDIVIADNNYGTSKNLTFSGNYLSGRFKFVDNPPYSGMQGVNTGRTISSGTKNYVRTFSFDVFWIDRTIPSPNSFSDNASGAGYKNFYLSGNNVGLTGSSKDDEFIVIGFTGTDITPPVVGGRTNFLNSDSFTAITGTKSLIFTGDWSGSLIIMDRAGNTTTASANISIELKDFSVQIEPEGRRTNELKYANNSTSSGYRYFWHTGTFASMNSGTISSSGTTQTDNYGSGLFANITLPSSGNNFQVIYKSLKHLSAGWTGNNNIRNNNVFLFHKRIGLSSSLYNSYWFKGFMGPYPTYTYSISSTGFMDQLESTRFRAQNPSNAQIAQRFFATGNEYTKFWSTYTGCTISNVVTLSPPSVLQSQTLTGDTIYLLEEGTHILTSSAGKSFDKRCMAIIGKGSASIVTNINVTSPNGMLNINDPSGSNYSNVIIDNIDMDGQTGHVTQNNACIKSSSTTSTKVANITINNGSLNHCALGAHYVFKSHTVMNNLTISGSSSIGIYHQNSSNYGYLSNLNIHNNNYGMALTNGNYHTLTNINSYRNTLYGYDAENQVHHVTIHNGQFYDNGSIGIRFFGSSAGNINSNNSINNVQVYNNPIGIAFDSYNQTSLVSNAQVYNNSSHGLRDNLAGGVHTINNGRFYNNGGNGIFLSQANDVIYFGTAVFFGNTSADYNLSIQQGTSNTVGRSSGVLITGAYTMSCDFATQPQKGITEQYSGSVAPWYYTNSTCSNKGLRSPTMQTPILCYEYGTNISYQQQPIIYSSTGVTIISGSYSSGDRMGFITGQLCPQSYLVFGDFTGAQNDIVNSLDLALLQNNLTVGFNTYYEIYDYNQDSYITAIDQSALIRNSSREGFWRVNISTSGFPW